MANPFPDKFVTADDLMIETGLSRSSISRIARALGIAPLDKMGTTILYPPDTGDKIKGRTYKQVGRPALLAAWQIARKIADDRVRAGIIDGASAWRQERRTVEAMVRTTALKHKICPKEAKESGPQWTLDDLGRPVMAKVTTPKWTLEDAHRIVELMGYKDFAI